jgi:hypothetical protein
MCLLKVQLLGLRYEKLILGTQILFGFGMGAQNIATEIQRQRYAEIVDVLRSGEQMVCSEWSQ